MLVVSTGKIVKGGIRLYRNAADRKRAVKMLMKSGLNYFVGFRDANEKFPAGLSYGIAEWAGLFPYVRDVGDTIVH